MATTSNYGITLVEQAQAQKEVTINQAITALDALVGNSVADKDLATPPGSPTPGIMYIIAASPTGAWAGKATQLTYFDQIWRFIVPQTNQRVWVADENTHYRFNGTAWVAISGGGGGSSSFDAITSGTNTTATMVVDTGASITASGSGTITATALPASGLTGTTLASGITASSLTSVGTLTGLSVAGTGTITSTSASALAVGANGATNPAFNVSAATASQVGGISIVGAATGGTTTITATDSGSNHGLTIASKGTGNLLLSGGSTVAMQNSGSSTVSSTSSQIALTNILRNATTNTGLLYTLPASGTGGNSLTAGSQVYGLYVNLSATQTHGSNTAITDQADAKINPSTHAFQTATGTITNAKGLEIDGAPIAGNNCAITNSSTIYSAGRNVAAGTTNSYGLNITANSGATNNYAARLAGSAGEIISFQTDGKLSLLATNTAGGTTGAQTINKPSGTVNFAASATSLVVTNALCTTSSIVFAVVRTNDATAVIKNVVPGSGSFTITLDAAATAETSVGFFIIN